MYETVSQDPTELSTENYFQLNLKEMKNSLLRPISCLNSFAQAHNNAAITDLLSDLICSPRAYL